MKVYIAAATGFCYGVNRAVSTCERLLKNGITVYTNGELVHNEEVVEGLKKMGLKTLTIGKEFAKELWKSCRPHLSHSVQCI